MSDGRLFTDYRPRCDRELDRAPVMTGTHAFRQSLIQNGDKIIAEDRRAAFTKAYSGPCVQPFDRGTMLPEADRFVCNAVGCARVQGDKDGLGTGRDTGMLPRHKESVDAFLADQARMQQRMRDGANCCACAGGDGYYPLPGLNVVPQSHRATVPGGARPLEADVRFE
jgi:hypothetical protein